MDDFSVRREIIGRMNDGNIEKRRLLSKVIPGRRLQVNN